MFFEVKLGPKPNWLALLFPQPKTSPNEVNAKQCVSPQLSWIIILFLRGIINRGKLTQCFLSTFPFNKSYKK